MVYLDYSKIVDWKEIKDMIKKTIEKIGTLEFCEGKYGGEFTGWKNVCIFSQIYNIKIRFDVFEKGIEGLSDRMINGAVNCINLICDKTDVIENIIKDYYDTEVKERAEDDFCDYIEMDSLAQLSQVMKPVEMYVVELGREKRVKVGLYFDCDWNEEDGFGIKFDGEGNILKLVY